MPEYIKDLVSVVIPTYKRSDMLGRAIKSVLSQTYKNLEVLVVSDNEPDDEYSLAASTLVTSFNDQRVRLILQEKHINGAAARNAGIRASRGEYIAFLDDDDYWEIKKVELQVKLLKTLDASYGGVTCKNKHYCEGRLVTALPPIKEQNLCKNILLRLADLSTDAIMLKRSYLDKTGYFDESLRRHQEVQLMTFFTSEFKVKLLDMYLVCVDSTKNENQPKPENMEKIKQDFFKSVQPIMEKFSSAEQKQIRAMHKFEIGLLYVRNQKILKGALYCLTVMQSPITFYYACRYVYKKIISGMNANKRVEKDAYTGMKSALED